MVLRIRLARFGNVRQPVYNIVLSQAKTARGSKPMEVLGTYNPIPQTPLATPNTPEYLPNGEKFQARKFKDIQLDMTRTKYWLGVGAQPTEPVEKLLCLIGMMEPKPSLRKRLASNNVQPAEPTPKTTKNSQPQKA
ncbi:hypothetical protein B0A52_05022 [Exophiala mesophila]|uniref:Ribosomal protein S16 n=1 Tax=Exophiala mesophila TaxID=212818 RepID=A0A438N6U1_EXOME|nr:hypothetical protein B0A52_05022 [Exophiala mesophila]